MISLTFAELGIDGGPEFWRNWVRRMHYLQECRAEHAELRKVSPRCRPYWYGDDGGDRSKRKYDYRQCLS